MVLIFYGHLKTFIYYPKRKQKIISDQTQTSPFGLNERKKKTGKTFQENKLIVLSLNKSNSLIFAIS